VALSILVVLSPVLTELRAQEFDTVISSHNRRAYTVADQIEDPQERQALATLFVPNVATEKARLAEEFLTRFPRSWLLPQALEIAAKAFIDLGDYAKALQYGRESLDLLPRVLAARAPGQCSDSAVSTRRSPGERQTGRCIP
jgi:hypothetical protein